VRPLALLASCLFLIAGCASTPDSAQTYVVRRGDTLSSIASRYKVSYQDLAKWNGIGRDYVIHPGQTLKLYPAVRTASAGGKASAPAKSSKSTTAPSKARPAPKRTTPKQVTKPVGPPVKWQWPTQAGTATLTSRPNGGYGLMIAGKLGEDIRAAGPGSVVYTGSGLLGYGQLIIVKHNESYLSAYGHLQSVLIKEGDPVSAGQRIATMGTGPQGSPLLYFEIRVNGSPGNPLALLPQRR